MSEPDEEPFSVFAEGKLACPICGEQVPVPVLARLNSSETGQALETRPDMTELWSHTWAPDA